ncbi:MAG: helix-turn-helix domain-containing protein [archaeon]|jgi:ArsR family transcriptional regulator|nr:helix-turn-helix domain-containing protein [archaeon]MDA1168646.1 helix-turn-helix domain-containing protein [archaeon]
MTDLDTALKLLQNTVRREILERLVKEPHYPMQLSDLIGISQQATMKHLKEMERGGLVESTRVPSEKGGPPRTIYSVEKSFSIRIDLAPDMFKCEQRKLPQDSPIRLSNQLPTDGKPLAEFIAGRRKMSVVEGLDVLHELSNSLERLDQQRDALIALHQHIRSKVSQSLTDEFQTYEERAVIQKILDTPRKPIDFTTLIPPEMLIHTSMEDLLESIRTKLERDIARREGQFIATQLNTDLRWYLMPSKKRSNSDD